MRITEKMRDFFSIHGLNSMDILIAFVCDIIVCFELLIQIVNKGYGLSFSYDELVAGLVSIQGYNKKLDLVLIRVFFIALIVGLYIFCLCMKLYKEEKVSLSLWYTIIGILGGYFLFSDYNRYLVFIFCAVMLFALCKNKDINKEEVDYINSLVFISCGFLSYICLRYFLTFHNAPNQIYPVIKGMGAIVVVLYFGLMRTGKLDKVVKIFLGASQILLPIFLLCIYTYTYSYNGEMITLHESFKWQVLCVTLMILFTFWNIYRYLNFPNEILFPTTFIVVPMIVWYKQPYGAITIDWFTYGEWTMPLQQLMSFGKLPYIDVYPVHGLCDYFYSAINYILFDGKFSEIYICEFIGNLIMIGMIGYLLYKFSRNKLLSFVLILFVSPQLSGYLRFFAGTILIIVLFSEKCENDKFLRLQLWVYLSMLNIIWYPAIGACFSIAFAPVALLDIVKEPGYYIAEMKRRKKSVIVLGLFALACAPLLLTIFKYILAEAGYSEVIQGQAILENVSNNIWSNLSCWIVSLGVCCWGLIIFSSILKDDDKDFSKIELFIFLVCLSLLIISYIFCSQEGRGTIMSRCLLPVVIVLVCHAMMKKSTRNNRLYMIAAVALPTIFLCANSFGTIFDLQDRTITGMDLNLGLDNKTPYQFVYVNGDDYGVENLGEGYLTEDLIHMIEDGKATIDAICGEDGVYVDFGSMPALYFLYDKENITKYTSNIIMSTKSIQESVIEEFEETAPAMMSLFPHCHLFVTDGIRNVYMWNWAIENGYVIRQNKSDRGFGYSTFLVKQENDSDAFWDGTPFIQSVFDEMGDYGWIPYIWGKDAIDETKGVDIDSSIYSISDDNCWTYEINLNNISGKMIDFLRLNVEYTGRMTVEGIDMDGNILMTETCNTLSGQDILFPLIASPNWVYCERIAKIKITFAEATEDVIINKYNFEELR